MLFRSLPKLYIDLNGRLVLYDATAVNTVLTPNVWTHVVATSDGTNVRYYINGVPDGVVAHGAWSTTPSQVKIGQDPAGTTQNFLGLIDEVRIYNRALTQEEITAAYNGYKVMTSFSINQPPTAVNLSVTPPDSTYCGITGYPPVRLNWEFSDPDDSQSAYQIQVATSSNFSSLVLDTDEIPGLAGQSKTFVIQPPYPTLSWNRTYYWRLKVWDSQGTPSTDWIVYQDNTPPPESFTTASHSYPSPNFTPSPQNPAADEVVTFIDSSKCYSAPGNVDYNCTTSAATQYQWDFNNNGIVDSTYKGNATTTYSTTNSYTVKLTITDELGQTCDTTRGVNVSLPLPEWKEISPF